MNDKPFFMKLASISLAVLFLFSFAFSCGSGGGGGGLPTLNYTSPGQAITSSNDATVSLADLQYAGASATAMANDEAAQAGYSAPKIVAGNAITDSKVDPKFKSRVDRLMSKAQSPTIKNAITKARLAKASLKTSVSVKTDCDNVGTGYYTIAGTDNSDTFATDGYHEASVTVTFMQCRDNTYYDETSGKISVYWKKMLDGSSTDAEVTITNLIDKEYSDGTFAYLVGKVTMNGTIKNSDSTSGSGSAGSDFVNASIAGVDYEYGYSETLSFNNLSNDWTSSTDLSGNTTDTSTMNGGIGMTMSGSGVSASFSFSVSNLVDKWTNYTSGDSAHWINGTVAISFNPSGGCDSGKITLATPDNDPIYYSSGNTCPISGTLQINNVTIVFGSTITVTGPGFYWGYTSCSQFPTSSGCFL